MNDKKFIYDLVMADFFERNGAEVLHRDIHKKTNRRYTVFKYNDRMREIYETWNLYCKQLKKY